MSPQEIRDGGKRGDAQAEGKERCGKRKEKAYVPTERLCIQPDQERHIPPLDHLVLPLLILRILPGPNHIIHINLLPFLAILLLTFPIPLLRALNRGNLYLLPQERTPRDRNKLLIPQLELLCRLLSPSRSGFLAGGGGFVGGFRFIRGRLRETGQRQKGEREGKGRHTASRFLFEPFIFILLDSSLRQPNKQSLTALRAASTAPSNFLKHFLARLDSAY